MKQIEVFYRRTPLPSCEENAHRIIEILDSAPHKTRDDAPYPPHTGPTRLVRVNARAPRKGQKKRRGG